MTDASGRRSLLVGLLKQLDADFERLVRANRVVGGYNGEPCSRLYELASHGLTRKQDMSTEGLEPLLMLGRSSGDNLAEARQAGQLDGALVAGGWGDRRCRSYRSLIMTPSILRALTIDQHSSCPRE